MLFNSYIFILFFLPCVFVGFLAVARLKPIFGVVWLFGASQFLRLVGLALRRPAACLDHLQLWHRVAAFGTRPARQVLAAGCFALGVGGDLALLTVFKYTDFLIVSAGELLKVDVHPLGIVLPLGISFFITPRSLSLWMSIARSARAKLRALWAFCFVFPHLIAGPVLHHAEIMPQFGQRKT